jgi:hypothetical protein
MACNKSSHLFFNPEKNTQLVPDSVARSIAENFNPTIFFTESNPDNHSPFKNFLDGHNTKNQNSL